MIDLWNSLEKPEECNAIAEDGDIVTEIDDVMFLCQRRNGFNNIICFKRSEGSSISSIRAMFKFIAYLYDKGVRYVRIEGATKRYKFLEKMFTKEQVCKDIGVPNRNVYYCNLEKCMDIVTNCIERGNNNG